MVDSVIFPGRATDLTAIREVEKMFTEIFGYGGWPDPERITSLRNGT